LRAFAEKLTKNPKSMPRSDIDGLRSYGLDDRAIHDAIQVIGYFNDINRVADALNVASKDFIRPWGAIGEK
jgi:alkylhydroperoxidase family enzyme